MSEVHVQFDGESKDISIEDLFPDGAPEVAGGTGVLTAGNNVSVSVKEALADYFDRSASEFSNFEVVLEPGGDITVRPPAVFG